MKKESLWSKLRLIFPKKERIHFLVLFFLILIKTVLDFLGVSLILPLVNLLVNPAALERQSWYRAFSSLLPSMDRNGMMLVLVLTIMAVYILKNLFAIYMSVVQNVFILRNQLATSARLLGSYMRKPYTFHLQHNTAEVVRAINTDVTNAYRLVSELISLMTSILITVLLIVYLVAVDLRLTVCFVLGLSIYSLVYFLLVRKKLKAVGQETRSLSTAMIKAIHQAVGGIKEVKLMGREQYFVDAYSTSADSLVKNYRLYTILAGVPKHLVEILCVCGVLGVVAFKIHARQDLSSIVGTLSAFAVASIRLLPSANTINANINAISYRMPSLNAVCELLDESQNEASPQPLLSEAERVLHRDSLRADIAVEHVSFTYPETDTPVLNDVSFNVRTGTSVGIVGTTGAGKTTLVDIILGLLTPQKGRILYGGKDIRSDYAQWQSRIGYIPQSIYLTDDSIRVNVALGIHREEINDNQVWKALEQAQLADFVRGLKQGLDTVIGERGVRLSGGQQQRIGIARALYHNPDVLFLDEATSALDMDTERAVMEAVHKLSGEKTCIIITHRLSTIANCDEIYEVSGGHVRRKERPE